MSTAIPFRKNQDEESAATDPSLFPPQGIPDIAELRKQKSGQQPTSQDSSDAQGLHRKSNDPATDKSGFSNKIRR